jgi:hypothetical protein
MIRNRFTLISFVSSLFFAFSLFANESLVGTQTTINSPSEAKVLYAKYKSYPNVIYTKQRFNVVIELDIFLEDDQFFRITTDVEEGSSVTLIEKDIVWYMNDDNQYEATFKFKAGEDNFQFPKISINLHDRDGSLIDRTQIKEPKINFRKIAINKERYSNIIAHDLQVISSKSRQFSNEEIMVLFELEATNGNLEEFYLSEFKNQGLKDFVTNKNKQKNYYFVMVPIFQNNIIFEYYNPVESKFIVIDIPVVLKEELVSTQTNLNPYENDMTFYKRMIAIVIILIFIMIYLVRKKKKYLYIAMVLMIVLLSYSLPNQTMTLEGDEKVYILPTQNSTVFKILKESEEVEILNHVDGYTKVLFKNNQIGWVKDD